jgi:hypothetical protein
VHNENVNNKNIIAFGSITYGHGIHIEFIKNKETLDLEQKKDEIKDKMKKAFLINSNSPESL